MNNSVWGQLAKGHVSVDAAGGIAPLPVIIPDDPQDPDPGKGGVRPDLESLDGEEEAVEQDRQVDQVEHTADGEDGDAEDFPVLVRRSLLQAFELLAVGEDGGGDGGHGKDRNDLQRGDHKSKAEVRK